MPGTHNHTRVTWAFLRLSYSEYDVLNNLI
nr:MAG TPA: hypothetical protein [Caudoviricetes sp.]